MKTIETEFGTLTLTNEVISIEDQAYRKSIRNTMWLCFLGAFTAVAFLIAERPNVSSFEFVIWSGILAANLTTGVSFLRWTWPESIIVDEIKTIKYRAPFGNGFLSIRLKNGRIRRVAGLPGGDPEIKAYLAANFPT